MRLPPAGQSLEIAIYSDSLTAADIGKLERWNLDLIFTAWLHVGHKGTAAHNVAAVDSAKRLRIFIKSGQQITVTATRMEHADALQAKAYSMRESEDSNA